MSQPIQSMQIAAVGLHELMQSYVKAGFSRQEAFELCRAIMVTTVAHQAQNPGGDAQNPFS